jgi:phospholipid-translocating ATPase
VLVASGTHLTFSGSWTLITWVIIPGSSLVMLLWIVLYSFFKSFDFVHEAQRLLGGVTFWVTVILSVAIALRELTMLHIVLCSLGFLVPRTLVKFISTSFASQDVDIVRYMWVKGNLKDSLGIRRRRNKLVIVDGSSSDPEGTPMFREPHTRSTSEMSTPDIYEPGLPPGLGDRTPHTRIEEINATPPQISASLVASSSSPHRPLAPPATTGQDEDMMTTPTSPAWAPRATAMPPSPQPSYYSASDIPLPSPVTSPGSYEPSQTYTGVASISYSRPLRGQYPSQSDNLPLPPNSYEMQVHSPKLEASPNPTEQRELSGISEAVVAEGERGNHSHFRSSSLTMWRASTLSTINDGPIAL